MANKNINWINAVKAFCIIFVFLRHTGNYYGCSTGIVGDLFIPFYVNAFFFVSGYLLFWKQLSAPRIDEDRKAYMSTGGGWQNSDTQYIIQNNNTVYHIQYH
jgi:peptidoglycan/LPS O-acetylase OafA/YrhL